MVLKALLPAVALSLAANPVLASDRLIDSESRPVQTAEATLTSFGVDPSDITVIGVYPDRGYGGGVIDLHVWVRRSGCKGWTVQRVSNPSDLFTLGDCNLPTEPKSQSAAR